MKLAAIIAEYNPFHNGHRHHLNQTRSLTGATHIMVLLSGGFVQRGGPAIADKWIRAEMAVQNGADLVCELPYIYAGAGAEPFADGSVSILNAAQAVDLLSFGSESGEIASLQTVADTLCDEPDTLSDALKHYLNQGMGFAAARAKAAREIMGEKAADLLKKPNDILAVEYLKAIRRQHSNFTAFTLNRSGTGHNDSTPTTHAFSSAMHIRACLAKGDDLIVEPYVPYTSDVLKNMHVGTIHENYNNALLARLTACDLSDIRALPDVSEGLEFAIKNALKRADSIEDIIDEVSSKRIPKSRVRRILAHLMMAATQEKMSALRQAPPYLRVLAMNEKGREIIKTIKSRSDMPILTNLRTNQTNLSDEQKQILALDIKATDLQSLFSGQFCYHRDYKQNPILHIEK